ncbi:hypothetical protein Oscil6304_3470 [Oscillatoria acuminata PCC 6304]|uniref:Uncharacterized protein n=1 Tax=Oscillatoria acuminata PCC 6304 TaxID=56110 RepID=K9TKV6_9CYAN|nr:hypothetical protein Oscil6304_3470 [Oscillatoria acuminata PCC 6304]
MHRSPYTYRLMPVVFLDLSVLRNGVSIHLKPTNSHLSDSESRSLSECVVTTSVVLFLSSTSRISNLSKQAQSDRLIPKNSPKSQANPLSPAKRKIRFKIHRPTLHPTDIKTTGIFPLPEHGLRPFHRPGHLYLLPLSLSLEFLFKSRFHNKT